MHGDRDSGWVEVGEARVRGQETFFVLWRCVKAALYEYSDLDCDLDCELDCELECEIDCELECELDSYLDC